MGTGTGTRRKGLRVIEIKNARTWDGKEVDREIPSDEDRVIDAEGLILLPGLIDPHVHFRTPGLEHKEDWTTAAQAAIRGGITTVFEMPNTKPAATTLERILEKKKLIDQQLKKVDIPLNYRLYLGADRTHFDQIEKAKKEIVGIKVFMGSSTGELLMDDESSLHAIFSLAKSHDLVLAVHAEDEQLLQKRKEEYKQETDPKAHSLIRSREVAISATEKALRLAKLYQTKLYLVHVSTKEEVDLVAKAKKEGIDVFAEACVHHLFLNEKNYQELGTKGIMNPPLRTQEDTERLWKGINQGVIDTIGSDHAPHTLEEKMKPLGSSPSGLPGVETTLPLMLNAYHQKRVELCRLVELMHDSILEIFSVPANEDVVLVDLNLVKTVDEKELKSRAGWSPYHGWELKGWPVYTIVNGRVYEQE